MNNIYDPLLEDLEIAIAQAQYLKCKQDEAKLIGMRSSWMSYLPILKSVPNLKSLKVLDLEIEKSFDKIFGETEIMSLIGENSNFYKPISQANSENPRQAS